MTIRFVATRLAGGPVVGLEELLGLQSGRRLPEAAAAALVASGPATDAHDALVRGDALAVTTGQQAGLFTGPLYTVYKALTAASLAEALVERWGRRVVPVFWVAGDDHDFAEVNHCSVLAADGALERITLRQRPAGAAMLPAYREQLGADVTAALGALAAALPPSEFHPATLAWLSSAYGPERSLAEANVQALAALLAPFGVVVARGWDPALKRAAAPLMLRALREARSLDVELAAEAERLRAAGAESPVPVGEGASLVLIEAAAGRDRLRLASDGAFTTRRSGETFSLVELERIAETDPGRLSGNVLLRPVLEAHLFPTIAYIGGPGELAYLAQGGPVFARLGVPRPVAAPRLSGFLIEARIDKVLARLRLAPGDLARAEGEVTAALVRDALPAGALAALDELRAALRERYAALAREAGAVDRTLERTVESARNQALAASREIEKKLVAHLKKANDTLFQQVTRARAGLFPDGRPQERVLTVASYRARYGDSLLGVLAGAARAHVRSLLEASPVRA